MHCPCVSLQPKYVKIIPLHPFQQGSHLLIVIHFDQRPAPLGIKKSEVLYWSVNILYFVSKCITSLLGKHVFWVDIFQYEHRISNQTNNQKTILVQNLTINSLNWKLAEATSHSVCHHQRGFGCSTSIFTAA